MRTRDWPTDKELEELHTRTDRSRAEGLRDRPLDRHELATATITGPVTLGGWYSATCGGRPCEIQFEWTPRPSLRQGYYL